MPFLFTPGPVNVPPDVLAAQAKPLILQDSSEFEALFRSVAEKAQKLFNTIRPVYFIGCSASGMQEAAIRNLVKKDVLCCVNGPYSQRWCEIAQACGRQVVRLVAPDGEPIESQALAEALRKQSFEAVTIVHNESSTGVVNPLENLVNVIKEINPETLILVDAATSLGGDRVDMDSLGLDFLFTVSYCCLALPPGLALVSVSAGALQKAEQVEGRGYYFDLPLLERHHLRNTSSMMMPIQLFYALDVQLTRILAEGLDNRFQRHAAMAERVQNWAEANGLPPLAEPGFRSRTVTSVQNIPGISLDDMGKFLLDRGMILANGYGRLRDRSFRIAHMGETRMEELEVLLSAIEAYRAL